MGGVRSHPLELSQFGEWNTRSAEGTDTEQVRRGFDHAKGKRDERRGPHVKIWQDLAPRDGHRSEHRFGECGSTFILQAVNQSVCSDDGEQLGLDIEADDMRKCERVKDLFALTGIET